MKKESRELEGREVCWTYPGFGHIHLRLGAQIVHKGGEFIATEREERNEDAGVGSDFHVKSEHYMCTKKATIGGESAHKTHFSFEGESGWKMGDTKEITSKVRMCESVLGEILCFLLFREFVDDVKWSIEGCNQGVIDLCSLIMHRVARNSSTHLRVLRL